MRQKIACRFGFALRSMRPFLIGLALAVLLAVGLLVWMVAMPLIWMCICIAVLARRLAPHMLSGNCWTYALPRWYEQGGWLAFRWSEGIRLLGGFRVPHAIWIKRMSGDVFEFEMLAPTERVPNCWVPWRAVWFHGYVRRAETPGLHDVRPDPAEPNKPTHDETPP